MMGENIDVNALIEKATTLEKSNEEFKIKVSEFEKRATELESTIASKDAEIGKLQKLLADNLIASKDKKDEGGTSVTSLKDAYKEAIKNNTKE